MDGEVTMSNRTVDIELGPGGNEIVTVDLDNLDPQPDDVLELLSDGECKVEVWALLGAEYLRKGYLDAAEKIGEKAYQGIRTKEALY